MNAEQKRLDEFRKFITEDDEFGNAAMDYLGSDMYPTLESLFNGFLQSEQLPDSVPVEKLVIKSESSSGAAAEIMESLIKALETIKRIRENDLNDYKTEKDFDRDIYDKKEQYIFGIMDAILTIKSRQHDFIRKNQQAAASL